MATSIASPRLTVTLMLQVSSVGIVSALRWVPWSVAGSPTDENQMNQVRKPKISAIGERIQGQFSLRKFTVCALWVGGDDSTWVEYTPQRGGSLSLRWRLDRLEV